MITAGDLPSNQFPTNEFIIASFGLAVLLLGGALPCAATERTDSRAGSEHCACHEQKSRLTVGVLTSAPTVD